jgi:hypothetical protein
LIDLLEASLQNFFNSTPIRRLKLIEMPAEEASVDALCLYDIRGFPIVLLPFVYYIILFRDG